MSIASLGAMAIGYFEEAVAVMVFFRLGRPFKEAASERSKASVRSLLALRPASVRLRRGDAGVFSDPVEADPGELFLVLAGERVALDGEVLEGVGFVDASALTGESLPASLGPGSALLAGSLVLDAAFTARALKKADQSAAARMAQLVETAARSKAGAARMVSRFAAVYTPIVVGAAALLAFLPPLLLGESLSAWTYRALVLLVISCPCALVLSVPLAYFCGMGGMAKRADPGQGSRGRRRPRQGADRGLRQDRNPDRGRVLLSLIRTEPGFREEELLALAAAAESLLAPPHRGLDPGGGPRPRPRSRRRGRGLPGQRKAGRGRGGDAGREKGGRWQRPAPPPRGSASRLLRDRWDLGPYRGRRSPGRPPPALGRAEAGAAKALAELARLGIERVLLLTGDSLDSEARLASRLGIAELGAGLLPEGKLERLAAISTETSARGGTTVFVGDGVNDDPALARSDVGVAMGSGSDAAIEVADCRADDGRARAPARGHSAGQAHASHRSNAPCSRSA